MRKAIQMGANRLPVLTPTTQTEESENSREIGNYIKVLELNENFGAEFSVRTVKFAETYQKFVEDGQKWLSFITDFSENLKQFNSLSLGSAISNISSSITTVISIHYEMSNFFLKLSERMKELSSLHKEDIETSKELKRRYDSDKQILQTAQQRLFQYEQGKVKPEKLGELEVEVKSLQRNLNLTESYALNQLKHSSEILGWSIAQQLINILSTYSYFFEQGSKFSKTSLLTLLEQVQSTKDIDTQPNHKWLSAFASKDSRSSFPRPKLSSELSFRVQDFPRKLDFEVTKGNKKVFLKKRYLEINLEENSITQYRKGNERRKPHPIKAVLQVVPSRSNSKKLRILWNWSNFREEFLFPNELKREQFHQFVNLLKRMQIEKKFSILEGIRLFVGTWNLGEAPPPDNLNLWFKTEPCDIYVISSQECEYVPRGNMTLESDWLHTLSTILGTDYIKVISTNLLSIRMVIFVRREHFYKIRHLEQSVVATGVGGLWGNKGAIGVSFTFNESTFCFIGSHLTPHAENVDQRDAQYRDILRTLKLGRKNLDTTNQFDFLFWCGDLNYRIDLNREEALKLISERNWTSLLSLDQLLQHQKENKSFVDFHEMNIQFPPTYRYNRGNRTYSEEKNRTPSYCDRILYRAINLDHVTPEIYSDCNDITTSDHSPVFATFSIQTLLPLVPLPNSWKQQSEIRITDLVMDTTASQICFEQPFVFFAGNVLENSKSTPPTIAEKFVSKWPGTITLSLLHGTKEYLEHQYIIALVKQTARLDDVGQGVIDFRQLVSSLSSSPLPSDSVPFKIMLFFRGLPSGFLQGKIQLSFVSTKRDSCISNRSSLSSLSISDV